MVGLIIDDILTNTYLGALFEALDDFQLNYNWLITNYECYPNDSKIIDKLSSEYCWVSGNELSTMIQHENFQWIWGVFSGFVPSVELDQVLQYELPFANGNEQIWYNPVKTQHPLANVEIIAWDGKITIMISKDSRIISKGKRCIDYARDLEEYNQVTGIR